MLSWTSSSPRQCGTKLRMKLDYSMRMSSGGQWWKMDARWLVSTIHTNPLGRSSTWLISIDLCWNWQKWLTPGSHRSKGLQTIPVLDPHGGSKSLPNYENDLLASIGGHRTTLLQWSDGPTHHNVPELVQGLTPIMFYMLNFYIKFMSVCQLWFLV